MRRDTMLIMAAAAALSAGGAVHATEWLCDFDSFTGSDGAAAAGYTDIDGLNPRVYGMWTASSQWSNLAPGWLTQGNIGGGSMTARFSNVADGRNGRARFGTALPGSMDADGGVALTWRMRVGPANPTRGPIQICVTSDGAINGDNTLTNSAFIAVRNNGGVGGTTIDILRNGGTSYSTTSDLTFRIKVLTLGNNLSDQWHQWSASVIRDPATGHGYWKLWLDGTQLLFGGAAGSPMYDPDGEGPEPSQQFSFVTMVHEGFDGTVHNEPYIGLGELNTQDIWDFEFDCVAYRDDGIGLFTCGSSTPPCDASVTPSLTQTVAALKGVPAPTAALFTFTNTGSVNTGYTVGETSEDGTANDYPWLALDKTGAASIAPLGGTDPVTASVTDTNMPAGTYTAYITFRTLCTPVASFTRRVDLIITDCASTVWPPASSELARSVTVGSVTALADVALTVTNTGRNGFTFAVEKEGADTNWLTLHMQNGGPLNTGASATVTASIDPAGVPVGLHVATLRFTNTTSDCTNAPEDHLRKVVLNVLGPAMALEQFDAEFETFTGSDAASLSPLASCDPSVITMREFFVEPSQVDQLDPGWLTQGSIAGVPTTALFNNPPGPASGGMSGLGRMRFRGFLPFDSTYDPQKGLAVAWRMRVGDYAPVRGPIQITFPRVAGAFGTNVNTSAIPGNVFNAYIRLQNGTQVSILRNGGIQYAGINTLALPVSIAGQYHQWTAAVCYQASDEAAYWNLWLDGEKLMFTGSTPNDISAGSPVGPGGQVYSFRTWLENVTGDPYVGLGESGLNADVWDFDFDWVRMLSYEVTGCPFWNGEGCVPGHLCNAVWADADGDGDVDMADFAALQRCYTGSDPAAGTFDAEHCRCLDHNHDNDVDTPDLLSFMNCATGPGVPWVSTPACP